MSGDEIAATSWGYDGCSDQPISLIDIATRCEPDRAGSSNKDSGSPAPRRVAKRPTKGSVREGLARRKYARWQADRYASMPGLEARSDSDNEGTGSQVYAASSAQQASENHAPKRSVSHHRSLERGRSRLHKNKTATSSSQAPSQDHEIDVLYENQRGWFFFGIPLYSHSSLLNFDPGAWMTKDGRNSAVNITNAQLPNPSWQWAWKSWYVDMSHDVDEEGWQYSFSFSRRFSWHGTHPWFHCFVRRRRWLRKRERKRGTTAQHSSNLHGSHTLNNDYFTIHPTRKRSPESLSENATMRESVIQGPGTLEETELPPEDVKDMPSLMKALRYAVIDREKIDAVKRFIGTGGDELVYLEQNIPDIMNFLVFQTSRIQLLEHLSVVMEGSVEASSSTSAADRRTNHMRKAILAALKHIDGLGYWSDHQHVLDTIQERDSKDEGDLPASSPQIAHSLKEAKDKEKALESQRDDMKPNVRLLPEENVNPIDSDSPSRMAGSTAEKAEERNGDGDMKPKYLPPDSVKVAD